MTRLIFNAVLLAAAIAVVFVYIKPTYEEPTQGIVALQEKRAQLVEAKSNLDKLKTKQIELLAQKNQISQEELDKLGRLLPQDINPVLFIMELDTIARDQGMSLKNIKFADSKKETSTPTTAAVTAPQKLYETFTVSFDITGSYEGFTEFLKLVEQGLRVTDISSVTLVANDKVNVYQYTVKAQTYWMK